jgi:hypothetical protein
MDDGYGYRQLLPSTTPVRLAALSSQVSSPLWGCARCALMLFLIRSPLHPASKAVRAKIASMRMALSLLSSKETAPTRDEARRGHPGEMEPQGCQPTSASSTTAHEPHSSLFKIAQCTDSQGSRLTVMSQGATMSARKIAAEIAHGESKAAWGKLDSNVLIGAVVISGAARTCLRKDRVAGHSALRAVQAFRPLVALIHSPSNMPHALRSPNTRPRSKE